MLLLILRHRIRVCIWLNTYRWRSKFLCHVFNQFLFKHWLINIIKIRIVFMNVGLFLTFQILQFIKFMANRVVIRILCIMDISLRNLLLLYCIWAWNISLYCNSIILMLRIKVIFRKSICLHKPSTILTRKLLIFIVEVINIMILIKFEFPH